MVHRGGLETSSEKNKKDDFNICIADDAKIADGEIFNDKIEELTTPKAKQIKRSASKPSPKNTPLPLSDHSISQSIVRVERSKFIKTKNNSNSKSETSARAITRLSPVRAGLRSNSLESHTSTTSNNNNAKAKKKKVNNKKGNTLPLDGPTQETVSPVKDDSKKSSSKLSEQLPLTFICSLPLDRLSGILENLKLEQLSTKSFPSAEEDITIENKTDSNQCRTLCLYCDKRLSTTKVRARHIERFHTLSKERRSSTRNPVTPSQDSKDSVGSLPACSSSSTSSTPKSSPSLIFSGCSFCSKSLKLQAVALENDLNALFYHLVDHHSDKYFACKLCAIRFQNAAKLTDHVQRAHSQLSKIPQQIGDVSQPFGPDEERNPNELCKFTPTKTRRQVKQTGGTESVRVNSDVSVPQTKTPSSTPSSSISRNGSMFSNDEPFLSRLGVTQNRLPRGRKGIRSRRQTNVDTVKPENSLLSVKTRSKVGRVCTSNDPIETVFRTPTNTRIEPLSCTFDDDFYEKVFINVRTNLSCHLDGKLDKDSDEIRPQSPPPPMPAIRSTVVKCPYIAESEVHTATSLAALTAFPTLLTAEQYGCDFGTAKIKRPITKHSWKWKWDSVKKYKYVNEGGKIVKKVKQPMLGLRDLSKLDMWTQLTMRQKHEVARKHALATSSGCIAKLSENSREVKQRQIDQLNTILDSRRLPQIILEQNEQTIIKLEITDEGFRYLAGELSTNSSYEGPCTSIALDRVIPANLNLIPSRSLAESLRSNVVLSGEWARPRCYVCFGCGGRFDKLKALEEHKMFRHPYVYSTHYEIVGRELIEGNLYKHFFIPLKALSRHKEYAQGIVVNKKTEDRAPKSTSNSGNEEESLDSIHSVTASFTTVSSSKLSDDGDTDTKTTIENVSSSLSYTEPSTLTTKIETTATVVNSNSIDCTKCNRNCHGMLELYRHMLDCSGDYAWIMAKKKKYRYYGSRKRRQFNKHNISALQLHKRKIKENKDDHESDETPKKKSSTMSPSTPRPRPSDADSIRKMLENLPPKRVCREIIPNATKPRSRKFKTNAGRKMQQNTTNKCKSSNTKLAAISKKILRNHKLRAISDKDKILRSSKIFENSRKSLRARNNKIVNKKGQSECKANKRTEQGNIVRKIGATTKRFVKKIKNRQLGGEKSNADEDVGKTAEKKPSKLPAVRRLEFDKEEKSEKTQTPESKESIENKHMTPSCAKTDVAENITEDPQTLSSKIQPQKETITIEIDFETTKTPDLASNENQCSSSENILGNLKPPQMDLSTSTEDLRKLPLGFLHNQVSPTTKRRSKKINDCIAMLTGKLQEKMGKPFLECKEAITDGNFKSGNTIDASLTPSFNDNKDIKVPKRKAFSRKIVKCDQLLETSLPAPTAAPSEKDSQTKEKFEKFSDKESEKQEPTKKVEAVKEMSVEVDSLKEPPVEAKEEPLPISLTIPEPELNDLPLKEPLLTKSTLNESIDFPLEYPSFTESTIKEITTKTRTIKAPIVNDLTENVCKSNEQGEKQSLITNPLEYLVKTLPSHESSKMMPQNVNALRAEIPILQPNSNIQKPDNRKDHMLHEISVTPLITNNPISKSPFGAFINKPFITAPPLDCGAKVDVNKLKNISVGMAANDYLPIPSRKPPPIITLEITTPSPVIKNEIPKKPLPDKKTPSKQHCIVNADTIRVPCIKPQQLTIPQFNPVQIPAPRGMITKRRQTIAGAPNDFLTEMNSLRCTNTYNNLPFELEVPLDLSKKPKRSSPKAKVNPKPFSLHLPQSSAKSNVTLMPPMSFPLPLLPQTQIIPILCESLQPKVPQLPLHSHPLVFPKEVVKLTTSAPKKRATNNKKQEAIVNISLAKSNEVAPAQKKVSKKINVVAEDKLKSCPVTFEPTKITNLNEQIVADVSNMECKNQTSYLDKAEEILLEKPNQTPNIVINAVSEILTQTSSLKEPTKDLEPSSNELLAAEMPKTSPVLEVTPVIKTKVLEESTNAVNMDGIGSQTNSALASDISLINNVDIKELQKVDKNEVKGESSPESQKSLPTRRSRRNKVADQNDQKSNAVVNDLPPPSALKEVEEIAASFISEDEQENEDTKSLKTNSQADQAKPIAPLKTKTKSESKAKKKNEFNSNEINLTPKASENIDKSISCSEEGVNISDNKVIPAAKNQDLSKKPRKRRKNELAAIVADQLLESFKEVDKSRIDDLKKLENLAYEKSEALLLTGMRLTPTTKRKNVLDSKKEISAELDSSKVISIKETKKQKAETSKDRLSKMSKIETEILKDPKDLSKVDEKIKSQTEIQNTAKVTAVTTKDDLKTKPLSVDFGNYRTNSLDAWSHRGPVQQNTILLSPENEKSPNNDTSSLGHKKSKKKQTKKRDKKIEIENINQLRTGLESFTFSKDVVDNAKEDASAVTRIAEPPLSVVGLFSPAQRNARGIISKDTEVSAFGSLTNIKSSSSILRPSILAASLDIATNKENPTQSERKSSISSRDPRLNKNIHSEDIDLLNAPPETSSRLATLRQRRKSLADVNAPTNPARTSLRSTSCKRSDANSRRNSIVFDDDDDDNYLTAIAKRVNDKIMSAEDKDFNLANDGFHLANSFLDLDDSFGRPSTSMSVRSAPNFNDDRSNMDTMDVTTNTDLIDMDVDDDMSVYTTFSQDTCRSKGRRRRRRRSVLLTRKPKKTNINIMDSTETFDCVLCNKKFAKLSALNKHQLTIAHVSKVSEQEYLNATQKKEPEVAPSIPITSTKVAIPPKLITPTKPTSELNAESSKQALNAVQAIRLEDNIVSLKVVEAPAKTLEKVEKQAHSKVPYIPPNSILNQSGIEPISSPEQNYERYSTKASSRLTLNPDERLFYECCNILKGSETPLLERTYPIVPPTTYAYDLQMKPVTPKSANERFSYIKQSTIEASGKRDGGIYPRIDINQFSDISSDSNPASAQPPPISPANYAQLHVLSGAKDPAVLPNDEGDEGALRSIVPKENPALPVLQIGTISSQNHVPPLTARTFVNQPSQIGPHLHGMESAATISQKQNFISPLHSASSQSSTITTTTCRLKTKAAMKGYDNLKVSIPTIGLDMEHALERSPRPGCKLTTLAEIALGNEAPMTALTSFAPMQIQNDQKSKVKTKPNDPAEHFAKILNQPKSNPMTAITKKRENSPVKEVSPVISVHDTESCMPIILNTGKKPESIIAKDIYEFDDSENTPISKAIQSPFKTADDNEVPKKAIIIPERPFKNIGMEEQEGIKFQKPDTPAINDENTTSTVTYSDRDDFVYGSISGGDEDNDNDNEDNKDDNMNSDESSNSSAFTAKTFENKSLIMGRIFNKNAKTKAKIPVEKPKLPTPEPPKQIPKQELDRLFDTLRGLNENRQAANAAAKEVRLENAPNSSRNRVNQSSKRKTPAVAKTNKSRTITNKSTKRLANKEENCSKEIAQLHAELGMSPAEIAELIGEGQRKSQRRCAVNRPKKLVEIWSSDEFEEFLSTKDIIALIEEKEQKTKKKRKSINATKKSIPAPTSACNNTTNFTDERNASSSHHQSEDEKAKNMSTSTQKRLRSNLTAAQTSKTTVAESAKNVKPAKGKKKNPTAAAAISTPKPTTKAQKEAKSSVSRRNSDDTGKPKPSPFKKPTRRNILSKAADDSESDFETELQQKSKPAPIRNRRKTISGKLENDVGSSSLNNKETVKSKTKIVSMAPRNSSSTKSTSADTQGRPQARRKRIASEMLYYWSSSSDEEFGRIESTHDDEDHIDESENYQQHGWIVGDSHKKLVTLLAIAKGNKKVDDCAVKEIISKKKS